MDKKAESDLFDRLTRMHGFREWLQQELDNRHEVLVLNTDVEAIRQAQGAARFIRQMIKRLDTPKATG